MPVLDYKLANSRQRAPGWDTTRETIPSKSN